MIPISLTIASKSTVSELKLTAVSITFRATITIQRFSALSTQSGHITHKSY